MRLVNVLVPQNRWDLLPFAVCPPVAVIVTHYEQPETLCLVLQSLAHQTLLPAEVIVADDGSSTAPLVPPGVSLVRQDDCGFRAAAARNLAVAQSSAQVLVFLDADTVPEPEFVAEMVRHVAASVDVLAVGRRRHAELTGGEGRELPEPAWLVDGYHRTRDLLDADGQDFQLVISSVLACRRVLFDDLGGFDERFVGYGGEDWDLAYRAWNAGALLVHERSAVAWHDGPDWARREARGDKDLETQRLAALIPHPAIRGSTRSPAVPDVLIDLPCDAPVSRESLARQTHADLQVRVRGVDAAWTTDQLRRARVQVELTAHARLPSWVIAQLVELVTASGWGEVQLTAGAHVIGTARSQRAVGRARRHEGDALGQAFGRTSLDVNAPPSLS